MSGTAFLINGSLSASRTKKYVIEKGLSDRIFDEIPVEEISKLLIRDFCKFLKESIPRPHSATKNFMDYLKAGTVSVYLRHDKHSPNSEWFFQFSFSGCAGEAQISSEFGAHVAAIWYKENSDKLKKDYFEPFGFLPLAIKKSSELSAKFIPIDDFGYAKYSKKSRKAKGVVSADDSILEIWEEPIARKILRGFSVSIEPIMKDGRCRCQLCMPDFQPLKLETPEQEKIIWSTFLINIVRVIFQPRILMVFIISLVMFIGCFRFWTNHAFISFLLLLIGLFFLFIGLFVSLIVSSKEKTK